MLMPVTAGSMSSARAAVFGRCDLGGDHPQGIVSPRGNSPVRGVAPTTTPKPATRDVPAADADVAIGELIAAQLPQVLLSGDASHGS
jgi:hypothetical protein